MPRTLQQDKNEVTANQPKSTSGLASLFASVSFEVPGTYSPERDCSTSSKEKGEEEASVMMTF